MLPQKATQNNRETNSSSLPTVPPVSTSSGTDVETAPSLLSALKDLISHTPLPPADIPTESKSHHVDTLTNFETYYKGTIEAPEDEELTTEKIRWKETNEFASAISSRAKRLHSAILQSSAVSSDTNTSDLKQEIIRLESELKEMDDKLEEIAKARNEAVASERRVRRGLYRLAGGRMSLEDVLKVCIILYGPHYERLLIFVLHSSFSILEGCRKRRQWCLIYGNYCND